MRKLSPGEVKQLGLGDSVHEDQSRIIALVLQFLVWWHVISTKLSLLGVKSGWSVAEPGDHCLRCGFSFCSLRGFTIISGEELQLTSWHLSLGFLFTQRDWDVIPGYWVPVQNSWQFWLGFLTPSEFLKHHLMIWDLERPHSGSSNHRLWDGHTKNSRNEMKEAGAISGGKW